MKHNQIFCGICGKAESTSLLQHIRDEHSLTPDAYLRIDRPVTGKCRSTVARLATGWRG